jgi:hypothetical protein
MTFFKREDYGRLYVIKLTFPDDTIVFKVGMTNSDRATNRMMEILRSWFTAYRFVPYTELKLDRESANPAKLEKLAHEALKGFRWIPDKKVDGGTEMFTGLDELRLLHFLRHLDVDQSAESISVVGNLLLGAYE